MKPDPSQSPALKRQIGLLGAVGLGLGSILGTGVFVSLGIAAGISGTALLPALGIAALLATANGLSSAQLAAAYPVSGGTYEYGYRTLGPWAGRSAGWCFLAAKGASAATAALGAVAYLQHLLGTALDHWLWVALAFVLVLGLTQLVAGGVQRSNLTNGLIVLSTITGLLCLVVAGCWYRPAGSSPELHPARWAAVCLEDPLLLLQATALLFVAFTGYGRIATLGEEVRRPTRTIPKAILLTLAVSALLYGSVAAVSLSTLGGTGFAAATEGDAAPLEVVARALPVAWLGPAISIAAIVAMAGVLLNLILGLSRVALAMARRHDLPSAWAAVESHNGSPRRAVYAVGATVGLLVLIGDVRLTWSFSAMAVLLYYAITNLSCLRLAPRHRRFPRWIALAGLAGCLLLAPLALLGI